MGGRAGAGHYQLSHLEALEAQSVHIMREVVAEFERPVLLFSGGKDSVVMLRLAEKAFWPARLPFPVMHVDTGHNFPEVLEFRDRPRGRARRPAQGGVGAGVDRQRTGRRGPGPEPLAQSPPDQDPARRHHRAPLRRRVRGSPAGRGEGPGQGTGVLLPGRIRAVGPEEPTPRAVGALQRAPPTGEHIRVFPCRTGPSSTSGSTSPRSTSTSRPSTSPTGAGCSGATGCCWPRTGSSRCSTTRSPSRRPSVTAPWAT